MSISIYPFSEVEVIRLLVVIIANKRKWKLLNSLSSEVMSFSVIFSSLFRLIIRLRVVKRYICFMKYYWPLLYIIFQMWLGVPRGEFAQAEWTMLKKFRFVRISTSLERYCRLDLSGLSSLLEYLVEYSFFVLYLWRWCKETALFMFCQCFHFLPNFVIE